MLALADEPKITDWLSVWFSLGSGVIALLALVAASIAVWATIQTNRNQAEQLKRLEEDRMSEKAARFALWYTYTGDLNSRPLFHYHNAGALPVYNVLVTMTVAGNVFEERIGTLAPTPEPADMPKLTSKVTQFLTATAEGRDPRPDPSQLKPPLTQQGNTLSSKDPVAILAAGMLRDAANLNRIMKLLSDSPLLLDVTFSDGERIWTRNDAGKLFQERIREPR